MNALKEIVKSYFFNSDDHECDLRQQCDNYKFERGPLMREGVMACFSTSTELYNYALVRYVTNLDELDLYYTEEVISSNENKEFRELEHFPGFFRDRTGHLVFIHLMEKESNGDEPVLIGWKITDEKVEFK